MESRKTPKKHLHIFRFVTAVFFAGLAFAIWSTLRYGFRWGFWILTAGLFFAVLTFKELLKNKS